MLQHTLRQWFAVGPLRAVFKNAGMLLSGRGLAGLFSLGALAISARALGPETFGLLILIHTYTRLVAGIVKFQSWQAVIRYGAACIQQDRRRDFQHLITFTMLLDVGSAVVGTALAAAAAPFVGPYLGLDETTIPPAMLYSTLILFTINTTPTGVLRLFGRFDLLAIHVTLAPGLRLIGGCLAYLFGAGLFGFLCAWYIAGIVEGLVLIVFGWRELRNRRMFENMTYAMHGVTHQHPGLWRFVWATNLHGSVKMSTGHLPVLMVGEILGPSAAGLYKIAQQFSTVLSKPAEALAQTIYPEFAKLSATESLKNAHHDIRRLCLRSSLVAGSVGLPILLAIVLLGKPLLELTVGEAFLGAYLILVLLVIAETIGVFGFALDSVMYAIGRPGIPLRVNLAIAVVYLPSLLFLMVQMELLGAGLAAIGSAVLALAVLMTITARMLPKESGIRDTELWQERTDIDL